MISVAVWTLFLQNEQNSCIKKMAIYMKEYRYLIIEMEFINGVYQLSTASIVTSGMVEKIMKKEQQERAW